MRVVSSCRTLREEPWSHWVAFGHFFEPLGHLGHQKSLKGAPNTPKGLPEVTEKVHIFDQKVDLCELHGFQKNDKKTRLKNTKKTHANHYINVPKVWRLPCF